MKHIRRPQFVSAFGFAAVFVIVTIGFCLQSFGAGVSKSNNGIYLAIAGESADKSEVKSDVVKSNDRLIFMAFHERGTADLAYPRSPGWGIKIKMTSPRGKTVRKTDLGKTYGAEFDHLRTHEDTWMAMISAVCPIEQNPDLKGARILAKPEDLFEMEEAGVYTLEIEMQMFRVIKVGRPWKYELLRFSPIKLQVKKGS